ncbi:MAG: hypothetical protein EHM42_01995 [Planctomycetaceae bacterium]|nr:MAG: hypothetical protein EHM42_01995 [Planctomycetaceae bacterium]
MRSLYLTRPGEPGPPIGDLAFSSATPAGTQGYRPTTSRFVRQPLARLAVPVTFDLAVTAV